MDSYIKEALFFLVKLGVMKSSKRIRGMYVRGSLTHPTEGVVESHR